MAEIQQFMGKSSNSWPKTLDAIGFCKVKMMGNKVCSQKAWGSPLKQNVMVSIVQVTALYWGSPINILYSAE